MKQKKFYTVREVAEIFNVSHDTVRLWVINGKIKGQKRGPLPGKTSPVMIPASEVERIQKSTETESTLNPS